jgi:hypothetical protein
VPLGPLDPTNKSSGKPPTLTLSSRANSGFPTTQHSSTATYAAFLKESRTRFYDTTESDGNSEVGEGPAVSLSPQASLHRGRVSERSTGFRPISKYSEINAALSTEGDNSPPSRSPLLQRGGNCRPLALPNFLLILVALSSACGFQNRTRGCLSEQRGRKFGCARDDKVKVGGLPEDSLVGSRGPGERAPVQSTASQVKTRHDR